MNAASTGSDHPTLQPEDPEFFTKYSAPAGLLAWAFGPQGGNPPPRITRPGVDRRDDDVPGADPVDRGR